MKRPNGVTVIALIDFLRSIAGLVVCAIFFRDDAVILWLGLVACVVFFTLSIGLWKMKNWARLSTVILGVLGLLTAILFRVFGPYLYDYKLSRQALLLDVVASGFDLWSVIYLLTPAVSRAFRSPMEYSIGSAKIE